MEERTFVVLHLKAGYSKPEYQITRPNEEWRPIPGYPNYEASNQGRIRSVFVHILRPKFNYRTLHNEPEYELVVIRNRRVLVHRLVAAAFIGPRPEGKIVHHRDHRKRNNVPDNLEYVTPSNNTRMAYAEGHIGRTVKVTAFGRKQIVEMYEAGTHNTAQLADQFGVHKSTVISILRRAGVDVHHMNKLTPKLCEEIRSKWIPRVYPQRRLAQEYGLSEGTISYVCGSTPVRLENRRPLPSHLCKGPKGRTVLRKFVARVPNHAAEAESYATKF